MRTLFVLLVGIAIGAFGLYYYQQRPSTPSTTSTSTTSSARDAADRAVAKTRAAASDMSDALSAKMQEWHLTPADIRADLAKSGQVAREKTSRLGEKVADVRIVAAIKAKYVLEKDIPANAVHVESTDGRVVLSGVLASDALVAKAVTLAMDTAGVQGVTSKITVGTTP